MTAKKDINDLKDGANFTSKQLQEKSQVLEKAQSKIADLMRKVQKHKDDEILSSLITVQCKNLYLEAYSRQENIKFMNIPSEETSDHIEDTEETLRSFLEHELGFIDARSVEIQHVH